MNLMLRQTWALTRKNLTIICLRRPISTLIRALIIPLAVVLLVSFSKEFFASPQNWGISSQHTIRSLKDGLAAAEGRDIVGFVDYGMRGGEVASVIDALSKTIIDAGKTPKIYNDTQQLTQECANDNKGVSKCYGAVVFLSSPEEGTTISEKGTWNYTVKSSVLAYEAAADVSSDVNGPELYILPLQLAVDAEIVAQSKPNGSSNFPSTIKNVVYTRQDQGALDDSRTSNFLALCIYAFGTLFTFTLIGIVYHVTSFVASERELGMSSLVDAMIPGGSNTRGRAIRQISTYISFAIVYFPSWIAVGIVISVLCFPESSQGYPVAFTIFAGLALTSFSLFCASFFKKSQLSGSITVVIALVFAILPQTLYDQKRSTAYVLSFLCPAASYTYLVIGTATFETGPTPIQIWGYAGDTNDENRVKLGFHWIFLVIHIVVFPVLAFVVEHVLFSTASPSRSFATPTNSSDPTVALSSFSKTYKPGFLSRIFKSRKDVKAVVDVSFNAYSGQILCLLGPNGSGKTTTLNSIAGQHKATSGQILIDPRGGLGYAPQNNVIWPDLTVEEHVRIFSDLKCISNVNDEVTKELVRSCDLEKKLPARAKTLSGGQKRKLQLAMMFAGGSTVCCVDEVSTGLDPISRRRIWEILLAERQRRTIIMTTHFLDEADYLADNIAIMYKGSLRAEGTAATLKNRFGNGYTIKLASHTPLDMSLSGPVEIEEARNQMVYRIGTSALAAEAVHFLESRGINDYQISGPTMEELFLKATGETIASTEDDNATVKSEADETLAPVVIDINSSYELVDGRPISVFKQWYILLGKRFRILRRRYIPYIVAVGFAIVGAGIAPKLINSFREPMSCPTTSDLYYDYGYREDLASEYKIRLLIGPPDKVNDQWLERIASIYSANHTSYPEYYGLNNATEFRAQLGIMNSYEEMLRNISESQMMSTFAMDAAYYTTGGLWLEDENEPVVVVSSRADQAMEVMNLLNNMVSDVNISTGYSQFGDQTMPEIYDFKPILFMIYYGLILAAYPAFFTLYPTNERLSMVRSMQYSNGIRPLPLWLSHLAFDSIFILVISVVATALLSASTPVWVGLGYIFLILFLYGITSALLSYVVSQFAKSAVAAWFIIAMGQVIFYFGYFGGLIGIQSGAAYQELEGGMNGLFFGMGIISPAVCLERAFVIGLGQFATLCNGRSLGSIYLFGGPILYLILQGLILFAILIWWDSTSALHMPSLRTRSTVHDPEATEMYSGDLISEVKRLSSEETDLRVESVSKSFGKNLAVDSVTFGVQTSEIFALLGPNGAGKSTIISMIRGDIKPSTPKSTINIAGHSILSSPVVARANLGVCPQFDSADVLTVTETLRFFAKTRGVVDIPHNVQTVIGACGLEPWSDQLAQKLSGGTKRKLSLAVALVGNPRVLVLDEPSSALDANAKRGMWRCLQSISKRRAVVLTTHSMEEADALADRIGIVSSRMLAVGEREELKRRAGDSFHIHLVSKSAPRTTAAELQTMKDWIGDTFDEGAVVSRETQGGQIRFQIPAEGRTLGGLIEMLERVKGDLGVEFFSVGRATLDEVFENIVRREGGYVET
ncbi:P-loop containing nucleoside triphosphate hydrolase protein [Lentithecium fluviatile CBS 122367]|uniref:P-loop containing nucleoside triphosphate hydrolase protein n=1 Tax=Lentithecium fluviatile CBS 122367 TaxID=1168545 RepID=A0A6G1JE49_9PLEO|nr:P-loop containing nucleoside triphosphate hydrolase protein [Lentithecium fluviatile CBS 122367]